MATPDYEARVLGALSRPDYSPTTVKALSREFGIPAADYPDFRKAVKRLVKRGALVVNRDKTLERAAEAARKASPGAILGTFRRSAKGFGFVRPKGVTDRADHIFIPEKYTGDASSGDEVAVKITRRSRTPGMNHEGKILQVVERASGVFVGTYFEDDGQGFVRVDKSTFREPIYVGDPGAKGARPGDKVVLEMVRFPSPDLEGEGVITEVLGPRGRPGVDTLMVLRAHNIPEEFDENVLREAREQARTFHEDDLQGRLDLRDLLTVTIDPATARDFDDAISLSRDDRGYWELGVHIADVAHFVPRGSDLDRAARLRGNSVYLPDRVVPMLPEILSNSLASLQQGKTRYAVSALIEFNEEGIRTDSRFVRSAIRVDHRFSYEQAYDAMMNPDRPIEGVSPEIRALLSRMLSLAMTLRKRRFARGALELTMPEVEVELGEQGEVVGAHLAKDDESHQVIEEFMLAANEAVAEFLTGRGLDFLRRGHDDPQPEKLREFAEFARSLGYPIESAQSRFELQRVLDESRDQPERYAVHFGLLRSLKRAQYTAERAGHYALASEDYCHFTSPIRRYPDLQVHRALLAALAGKRPKEDVDELVALAEHCSRTERRAESAEQELIKIKLLTYLADRIGQVYHAVIIGVEDFGFFCQLIELPVEGLVHLASLQSDYYDLERETHSLTGRRRGRRFRLGDRVEVRIWRVDVDRRELDLVLSEELPSELPSPEARGPRPRPSGRPGSPPSRRPSGPPKPRKKGSRTRRS
ncbi:ribonuclease R [Tautonia sociabilis]|uniref:Ribonuclease R n=1 Tax=Tautonia sociabilis TaxID=2080755 RepID=A0A432MKR3_9BACT|nr:ribonuclease R [Tautonia sociabilis]RUL87726.1 ribonuclease R [Tautonia sociabilis]